MMNKRDWIIAAATSVAVMAFIALATLFAWYSNGYAAAFLLERIGLAEPSAVESAANLEEPGRFTFIRQGALLASQASGEGNLVLCAVALEGTYTVYMLRCDTDGRVVNGLPLYSRGCNQTQQVLTERLAVLAGRNASVGLGSPILASYVDRIWSEVADAAKQATVGALEVADGN